MKTIMFSLTVFIALLMAQTAASCFFSKLQSEMTVSKRVRFYCEYKMNGKQVLQLLPGSKLLLADQCLDCSCTSDGLKCCGFGRNAGVVSFPDFCEALNDGCQTIAVLKSNHSRSCTNETIDFDAISKQLPHPDNAYGLTGSTVGRSVHSKIIGGLPGQQDHKNIRSRLYEYLSSMLPGRLPVFPGNTRNTQVTLVPGVTTPRTTTSVQQGGFRQPQQQQQQQPQVFLPQEAFYPAYGPMYPQDLVLPWLLFT